MRSKILIFFFWIIFNTEAIAENLLIQAKNITLDKDRVTSIFKNDVVVKTKDKTINSDYVEYNKETGYLVIKNNVIAQDLKNNIIKTQFAEYFENKKIFVTQGPTTITTSEKYIIEGQDMIVDNKKRIISSESQSTIKDNDGNIINIENFQYNITSNIFKSIGYVKIEDKMQNSYEFSQLYIDTKKKEILGTDIKAFLNQDDFKINKQNKPRIFGNTLKLNKNKSSFSKSVFTICDYRENNKCPPWTIQASEMLHDNKKKTIFYEHAVIKVYDILFYVPRLSHPDPLLIEDQVLPPSITNLKLRNRDILPYFFAVSKDKNLTVNTRIYDSEHLFSRISSSI